MIEVRASTSTLPLRTEEGGGAQRLAVSALPQIEIPGLYVHIPFCFHKCHYCDFYSITRQTPDRMARFVDLILREADMWRGETGPTVRPRTIFFGGGTPSLLPLDQMRRLIAGLKERFDLSAVDEWTIEVNPATAALDYCRMLRESGANRLSFGAQSFNAAELKTLERHHDPADVPRSLELARAAGFTRLNVDLIYAIPGQTLASWQESLNIAVALGTPHISAYNLTYEPNTPMAVKKRLGLLQPTEESIELQMMHEARRVLSSSGRLPYEISNYAIPGEECRHNLLYWMGGSYIGLGPSAASHVKGTRFKNRPHLGEWENAIESGRLPATDVETLGPEQRHGELLMLMLRLTSGVSYSEYNARSGCDARLAFGKLIEKLAGLGLLDADHRGFRLTEAGLNVADAVSAEFLAVPTP